MSESRWRVGRKLGRTLYLDDKCIGMVDTPELARDVVGAMNVFPTVQGWSNSIAKLTREHAELIKERDEAREAVRVLEVNLALAVNSQAPMSQLAMAIEALESIVRWHLNPSHDPANIARKGLESIRAQETVQSVREQSQRAAEHGGRIRIPTKPDGCAWSFEELDKMLSPIRNVSSTKCPECGFDVGHQFACSSDERVPRY